MTVKMDKFKVGDKVTWRDDDYATLTDGRSRFGDGPFVVEKVHDLQNDRWGDEEQSTWESVGHTQHLELEGGIGMIRGKRQHWSGAFFKVVS